MEGWKAGRLAWRYDVRTCPSKDTKRTLKDGLGWLRTRGLDGLDILLNSGDRGTDRRVDGGREDGGVLRSRSLLLLLLDVDVGYYLHVIVEGKGRES